MATSLTILGSGGWFSAHDRLTASALLRDGSHGVVIDAGSGLARLLERPELFDGVQRLDFVLTHFHLDHVVGLACLPALGRCAEIEIAIWGPGRLLHDRPTAEILGALAHEPYHPVPLEGQGIEVFDLSAAELELGGHVIRTRRQDRHSSPTLGLRFDDVLAWVTDTAHDPATAQFAAGCRVLAHEAWYTRDRPRTPDVHSAAGEAATLAREAGVEELLLIHLPPFAAGVESLVDEAEAEAGGAVRVTAAADGADVSALLRPRVPVA